MARGDLLKKLLRGFKSRDEAAVLEAAREIIEDERKKHHTVLAQELTRILENGHAPLRSVSAVLDPLPKDADRGVPLLEVRRPDTFFKDLIHPQGQRELLGELVQEYRQWEVLEANGLRPRTKMLFCGPPGCGKTATAEALANELGLPLLYVNFDSVVSSLLGETAANLRKVFDYAARGMWVLFFDEFDAVGRSRDDPTEHGELKRVVNAFLQMLDRFTGRSIVVAATNFEQSLDPALWRRFDEIIRFELPESHQIGLLLQKLLAEYPHPSLTEAPTLERFAGATYADVERVCLDLLRHVVLEGKRAIEQGDLDRALLRHERRKQALARSRGRERPSVDQV